MPRPARRLLLPVGAVALGAVILVGVLSGERLSPSDAEGAVGSAGAGPAPADQPAEDPAPATAATEPTLGEEAATDPRPSTAGGQVDVVLSYTGWDPVAGVVEVAGYVAGVVEDGGTCSVTLTSGEESVTAQTAGLADASTTVCRAVTLGPELSPGDWRAVLSYESPTSSGSSDPVDVEVPAR